MIIPRSTLEVVIFEGADVVVHTDDYNFIDIKLMAEAVSKATANGKNPKLHIKGASAMDVPTLLAVVRAAQGGVVVEGRS